MPTEMLGIVDDLASRRRQALASARTASLKQRIWPKEETNARPVNLLTEAVRIGWINVPVPAKKRLPAPKLAAAPRLQQPSCPRDEFNTVLDAVCITFGIGLLQFYSPWRSQTVVRPRYALAGLLKSKGYNTPSIAEFARRDNTTVWDQIRRCEELYALDPEFRAEYDACRALLETEPT